MSVHFQQLHFDNHPPYQEQVIHRPHQMYPVPVVPPKHHAVDVNVIENGRYDGRGHVGAGHHGGMRNHVGARQTPGEAQGRMNAAINGTPVPSDSVSCFALFLMSAVNANAKRSIAA